MYDNFNDLYDNCLTLSRLYAKETKIISYLESNYKRMQVELDKDKSKLHTQIHCLTCDKCVSLESIIFYLNQVICN